MASSTRRPVLSVCATCFRGPPIPELERHTRLLLSDSETLRLCAACHCSYYCSKSCQRQAWSEHRPICKAISSKGLVCCVEMSNPNTLRHIYLAPDNPIFDKASVSPVMERIGIPLSLLPTVPGTNNQWCTYFMIDPVSGLAPYHWQDLGTVIICRQDRMPVSMNQVNLLGDFFSILISMFGSDDDSTICDKEMNVWNFIAFTATPNSHFNEMGNGW